MGMDKVNREEITVKAYQISQEHKSYDQFAWMLAEAELTLQYGKTPSAEIVRSVADAILNQHLSVDVLHWLIAEKRILFEKKQSGIK